MAIDEQKVVKLLNMAEESIRANEKVAQLLSTSAVSLGFGDDKSFRKDLDTIYTNIVSSVDIFEKARKGETKMIEYLFNTESDMIANLADAKKKFTILNQQLQKDGFNYDPTEMFGPSMLESIQNVSGPSDFIGPNKPASAATPAGNADIFTTILEVLKDTQADIEEIKNKGLMGGYLPPAEKKKKDKEEEKQTGFLKSIANYFGRKGKKEDRESGAAYASKLIGQAGGLMSFDPDGFLKDFIKYKLISKIIEYGSSLLLTGLGALLSAPILGSLISAGIVSYFASDRGKSQVGTTLMAKLSADNTGLAGGSLVGAILGGLIGGIPGAAIGGAIGGYVGSMLDEEAAKGGQFGLGGSETRALINETMYNGTKKFVDIMVMNLGSIFGFDDNKYKIYFNNKALNETKARYQARVDQMIKENEEMVKQLKGYEDALLQAKKDGNQADIDMLQAKIAGIKKELVERKVTQHQYEVQIADLNAELASNEGQAYNMILQLKKNNIRDGKAIMEDINRIGNFFADIRQSWTDTLFELGLGPKEGPQSNMNAPGYFRPAPKPLIAAGKALIRNPYNPEVMRKPLEALGAQMLNRVNNNSTQINNSSVITAPTPVDTRNPYLGGGR